MCGRHKKNILKMARRPKKFANLWSRLKRRTSNIGRRFFHVCSVPAHSSHYVTQIFSIHFSQDESDQGAQGNFLNGTIF